MLLTHHHADHVQGLELLLRNPTPRWPARPPTRTACRRSTSPSEGDAVTIGDESGEVIDVSGHTWAISPSFPQSRVAFTADSLMALGCGRVFEGTMPQMWDKPAEARRPAPDTIICARATNTPPPTPASR